MATVETLEIEIKKKASDASDGLEGLISTLTKLRQAVSGGAGLSSAVRTISRLNSAITGIRSAGEGLDGTAQRLERIAAIDFTNIREAARDIQAVAAGAAQPAASAASAAQAPGIQGGTADAVDVEQTTAATKEAGDAAKSSVADFKAFSTSLNTFVIGAAKKATAPIRNLGSQFLNMARAFSRVAAYRAIRATIKNISVAAREGVQNLVRYSAAMNSMDASSANATMSAYASTLLQVKNSVGAAVMPVLTALLPLINTIASAFITAANAVNQFFQALSGKGTFTKAKKNSVDYAKSLGKATGAAKELQKTLMGFDEINRLDDDKSGGGGGVAGTDFSDMFEESEVSDKVKKIAEKTREIIQKIEEFLNSVLGILLTSVGLFVIGAILAFSGANIPLGLGLMAAGAYLFATGVAEKWNELSDKLKDTILKIMLVVGAAVFVVGTILAFSGANIPLGIGLMAAGAAIIGAAAKLDWNRVKKLLQGPLGAIMAVLSGGLLVLGAILTFSGANVPLGIGLMLAGAAGLGSIVAINWDNINQALSGEIGKIVAMISGALIVIGLILTFTGVALPLGVGLILVGVAAFGASAKSIDWDAARKWLVKAWEDITRVAKSIGLIALGALLCFTGAGIPLGIGMLIEGGASLAEKREPNWNSIFTPIKAAWEKISNWWNGSVQPTIDKWKNAISNIFSGGTNVYESGGGGFGRSGGFGKVSMKAAGGFVTSGQLFVARESGPELVGSIGGQTAVANNDQIVEAVSLGVARAMASVMSSQSERGVHVYLDGREITASQNRRNKSYGYAPVGV